MAAKKKKSTKKQPTGVAQIVKAERTRDALTMRKNGMDYRSIGEALGISAVSAQHMVRDAIAAIPEEAADDMRSIMSSRLDQMLERTLKEMDTYDKETTEFLASNGMAGKIAKPAVLVEIQDHILRIEAQRAKLFGLNAAVKVEGSGVALVGIADLLSARDAEDDGCPVPPTLNP